MRPMIRLTYSFGDRFYSIRFGDISVDNKAIALSLQTIALALRTIADSLVMVANQLDARSVLPENPYPVDKWDSNKRPL